MFRNKTIQISLLIGLVILLSAWLVIKSVTSTPVTGRADLPAANQTFSTFNKITGLPEPGTYQLQKIFHVPKYNVLDTKGKSVPLSKYTNGKMTLLTFFYERCSDVNGCPYAMGLFHNVKNKLERDQKLSKSLRFVHISFDPNRDTPMMMAGLEKRTLAADKDKSNIEWDFLTTESVDKLMPLIDGFGQNVDVNMNPTTGDKSLSYSHVLKMFLIDKDGFVREIYSTYYLSAEMLINDIKTLAVENNK